MTKAKMESTVKPILITLVFSVAFIAGIVWWSTARGGPDVLARNGLHWHPELTIYVDGEQQEIPQDIGIGQVHAPIHTHNDLPALHLEFSGMVRKEDVTLGSFFRIWDRDMRSFGENVTMTVNGEANAELEEYSMRDGDKIELRYE